MIRIFLLLTFFFSCFNLYGSLLVLDNTSLLKKLNVELIYEIRTLKPLHILIDYYEPVTYSNFYNSQEVREKDSVVKGDYTITLIERESYRLSRILTTMRGKSFFMNKSYVITSLLDLKNFFLTENIQIDQRKVFNRKYLKSIKSISSLLNDKSIISRIINTVLMVKKNFKFANYDNYEISKFLNILVDAYKLQKINARVVHGYSIPSFYRLKTDNSSLVIVYPMGSYHWIEIFLPDFGWLPIDPFSNVFFFTFPNLIRKSHGEYFKNNLDMIFVYPKKPSYIFRKEILFSEDDEITEELKAQKVFELSNYVVTAPIQITQLRDSGNVSNKRFFLPKNLDLFNNSLKIDMEVTENKTYSQMIFFDTPTYIKKIIIPLYFLELTKTGRVWIEVENGGKVYKTEVLRTPYHSLKDKYRLYCFKFSSPIEVKGKTVFTLRTVNISAVFWYAMIGNIIGGKDDTVSNDGEIINADLCIFVQ